MEIRHYPLPDRDVNADAVILADGDYPMGIAAQILSEARYVVCCDGAANEYIHRGNIPSAIVGDCDSVSEENTRKFAGILHRFAEQESNDLTKAFRFCMSQGKTHITILGATGRREDHTLANISLLADYAREAEVQMITNTGIFNAIANTATFGSCPGQQVSIFTISTITAIDVEGLKYIPPQGGLCSWWRGSLNEATDSAFTVFTNGATLIFRAF